MNVNSDSEQAVASLSDRQSVCLTNGANRYRVFLNAAGRGGSFWNDIALTRWRGDRVEDADGIHFWLRDLDDGRYALFADPCRTAVSVASPAFVPESDPHQLTGAVVLEDRLLDIEMTVTVRVDPETDRELRRIQIRNASAQQRNIEITSHAEIVLNNAAADEAHPAFSKLFVQTQLAENGILLAQRRPRAQGEQWPVLAAMLQGPGALQFETARSAFLGRGYALHHPKCMREKGLLSGRVGNILDPVLVHRRSLCLAPGQTVEWLWSMAVADTPEAASRLLAATYESLPVEAERLAAAPVAESELCADFEFGSFNTRGDEYVMSLRADALTGHMALPPQPWVNVIANPDAGLIVSEQGAGYTWAGNSREHRLTPWSNDPQLDPHGEVFYLRDDRSGRYFSLTPGPIAGSGVYTATHGQGYSRFDYADAAIRTSICFFMPVEGAHRIARVSVRLTAPSNQAGTFSLFVYQRMQVANRLHEARNLETWLAQPGLMLGRHPGAGVFADRVVFSALLDLKGDAILHHCFDRHAFLGDWGSPAAPAALSQPVLDDRARRPGQDPCFSHQAMFSLAGTERQEFVSLLGAAATAEEVVQLRAGYGASGAIDAAWALQRATWAHRLSRLEVVTPDHTLNRLLNYWLPYQNLSCRIWGRSAFYQSGGAFGYRDQLQDAAAFLLLEPGITRQQILLHAAHQFQEGDVLHWWHPEPVNRGLRTRFSDDLLWLPYVVAIYVAATGDTTVLEEMAGFLTSPFLDEGEDERFLRPEPSGESADLYAHCCRALQRGLTQGVHGLPLMGSGDWNDGMNRVGREGRGESVWMACFVSHIIDQFIPLARLRNDDALIDYLLSYQRALRKNLHASAWDGDWYLRAWYDDGATLGSHADEECRIDALVQAWSVISGLAPPDRARIAMASLEHFLVDDAHGLVCLLTPPFEHTASDPGYIRGYVAGVRENGGQYTHAACWVVRAMAELGRHDRALQLLKLIGPAWHSSSPERMAVYQVEPYVIAADIYGVAPHQGRGGWTWYTGAAGWYYRVAIETIIGFSVVNGTHLRLMPRLPEDWPELTLRYRWSDFGTLFVIQLLIRNDTTRLASLDGVSLHAWAEDGALLFPVKDDGQTHVLRYELSLNTASEN